MLHKIIGANPKVSAKDTLLVATLSGDLCSRSYLHGEVRLTQERGLDNEEKVTVQDEPKV